MGIPKGPFLWTSLGTDKKSIKINFKKKLMFVGAGHVEMSAGVSEGQKRVPDPLDLELQVVVN